MKKRGSKSSKKSTSKKKSSEKSTKKKSKKTNKKSSGNFFSNLDKDTKKILSLFTRYAILLIIVFLGVELFYAFFAPLTIYGTYWMFELFFNATLNGNLILINGIFPIEIIGACVAGSAYALLMILNLTTPGISFKNRVYSILLSFAIILVLNLLRIFLLGNVYVFDFSSFDFLHSFFWYFLSIVFVVCTWFAQVRIFNIKDIPVYTDLKYLYNLATSK